jgi:hypothetical protein
MNGKGMKTKNSHPHPIAPPCVWRLCVEFGPVFNAKTPVAKSLGIEDRKIAGQKN